MTNELLLLSTVLVSSSLGATLREGDVFWKGESSEECVAPGEPVPPPEECLQISYEVDCSHYAANPEGLDGFPVDVRVYNQLGTGPTVVLLTGEGGTQWYLDSFEFAQELRDQLIARPLDAVVVDVKWDRGFGAATGWYGAEPYETAGVHETSCRPATLFRYLHDNLGNAEASFCPTGNSGGAGQVMNSLAMYDGHEYMDVVVPTSGPEQAGVSEGCLGTGDPEAVYNTLERERRIDEALGFHVNSGETGPGPCEMDLASWQKPFARMGTASARYNFQYETTRVRFLTGETEGPLVLAQVEILKAEYLQPGIVTDMTHEVVEGAGHKMADTLEGKEAILTVLGSECLPEAGPAPSRAPRRASSSR